VAQSIHTGLTAVADEDRPRGDLVGDLAGDAVGMDAVGFHPGATFKNGTAWSGIICRS
jgi:hypothetical protein